MPNRREPLVRIDMNSNARPGSSTRRSLPEAGHTKDAMDRDSPRGKALKVTPPIRSYYLDVGDDRSE